VVLSAEGFRWPMKSCRQHQRQNHAPAVSGKDPGPIWQGRRIWIMDRGIPTEKILRQMRRSKPPVGYLVGTPRGRWINSRINLQKCRGRNCGTLSRSNCSLKAGRSMCWPRARAGAKRKRPSAQEAGPAPAHPAHAAPRRAGPGSATPSCTSWARPQGGGRAWSFVKITVPGRQPVNRDTFRFELLKDKLASPGARRPLSAARLRGRRSGRAAVGAIHAVDRNRGRVPDAQKRSATASHRHHVELRIEATFWSVFWPIV